jgi:hypothetical protein
MAHLGPAVGTIWWNYRDSAITSAARPLRAVAGPRTSALRGVLDAALVTAADRV